MARCLFQIRSIMTTAAQTLAGFAAGLTLSDIPSAVRERAKDCLIDSIGVGSFGARFPWSRMVVDHAKAYGEGGPCTVLGQPGLRLSAPFAALANGCLIHAFEQDNLRQPGVGVHAGATIVPALLAAAEETGADGKRVLTAFIAAIEVMFRIGLASHHTPEKLGFHAPGLTGPYGSALAAGLIYGLDADKLANAMGIAGSMSGGLLAFTKAKQGAMVKRLHMGRACEAGLTAARLAQRGYDGAETILDGKFGFLQVYCQGGEAAKLTAGLGEEWEVMRICLKRYACHATSHPAVQALRELMAAEKFSGSDVQSVSVEASDKIVSHHVILEPADIMQGQYSLPFNIALALHRDPDDAASFDDSAVKDEAIRGLCRSIKVTLDEKAKSAWGSRMHFTLKDGRKLTAEGEGFKGMPQYPLDREELKRKFMFLMKGQAGTDGLFEHLADLEKQAKVLPGRG
jgi:2-methylcitrate dehydratase PrpD